MVKLLWLFLYSTFAIASIPLPESLFRNGSNQNITKSTVVVKFKVRDLSDQMQSSELDPSVGEEGQVNISAGNQQQLMDKDKFYRLYFFSEGNQVSLLQVEYSQPAMRAKHIKRVVYEPNLMERLRKLSYDLDKNLFYSTMMSQMLNRADGIINFLHSQGIRLKRNNELLDKEKLELLARYKKYLKLIRATPTLPIRSPLRPKGSEARQQVDEIMGRPLYTPTEDVRLIKSRRRFYWLLDLSRFRAYFSNEEHQLSQLEYFYENKSFSMDLQDYILFDGVHELPKNITLQATNSKVYVMQSLDMAHIGWSQQSFQKKVSEMQNWQEKNNSSNPPPGLGVDSNIFLF